MGMSVGRLGLLGVVPFDYGSGGGIPPAFPPQVAGTNADIAADFIGSRYVGGGASQTTFAAWLTAIGGTFTRASTATYIDAGILKTAAANTARFPTGLGIRLTGAVTNIWLNSNSFTTGWTYNGPAPTPNAGISPDGTNNAWLFTSNTGSSTSLSYIIAGLVALAPQTATIFAKQGTSPTCFFQIHDQTAGQSIINATPITWNGTNPPTFAPVAGTAASAVTSQVTPLANGWWRFDVTYTAIAPAVAGDSLRMIVYPENTGGSNTGVTSFFYGAQVTNSAFGQDYVPTTTAAVTQAAEILSFPYTQATFSALVGANNQAAAGLVSPIFIGTNNANAPIFIGTVTRFGTFANGVALNGTIIPSALTPSKNMVAGSPSGRSLVTNGLTPVSDANPLVLPAATTLTLGQYNGGNQFAYGNFSLFSVWSNLVAPAADMQRLTTLTLPSWLPLVGGAPDGYPPNLYADTIGNGYWLNGQTYATFSAWFTALGGSFTRASTATYIEGGVVKTAAANTVRFPAGQGMRLTGAVTNIALWSEDITNSVWVKSNVTATADQAVAPDGNPTADLMTPTGTVLLYQALSVASSTSYTFSVWVKAPTSTPVTGTFFVNGSGVTPNPTILNFTATNTWQLLTLSATGVASSVANIGIGVVGAGVNLSGPLLVWGWQATNSAFQQDYVPTTTVSATQAADTWSFPHTATTFSVLVGTNNQASAGTPIIVGANNNNAPIFIQGFGQYNSFCAPNLNLPGPSLPSTLTANKVMAAGSPTGRSITALGKPPTSDANTLTTAVTSMALGQYNGGVQPAYGNFSQFGLWDNLVAPAAEMQRLTT